MIRATACITGTSGPSQVQKEKREEVTQMKCPYCGHLESKVVDSRPADEGTSIRRRRECLACQRRFTTYETMESLPLVVIKKDGSRQTFDRGKVLNGMIRACEKRPVPFESLEKIADQIEQELQNSLERETSTERIGELVMDRLKGVDEVAYVRFASVYRQFKDINTFMTELNKLLADK
jgi:transcriptional repressor NrdR